MSKVTLTNPASLGPAIMPYSRAASANGFVFVAGQVALDKDNNVVVHLGYDPEWTKLVLEKDEKNAFKLRTQPARWEAGKFVHPHDACYDKDGNIFVVEWVPTGRVSLLRKV